MKPILNYSTSIPADKTLAEIQKELASHGNIEVLVKYEGSIPSSISFRVTTSHGVLSFLLPAKINSVLEILKKSNIPKAKRTLDQATRVTWRIVKDWIEAQMALVKANQVTVEEAFFPFIQNTNGKTLYGAISDSGFKGLALPVPDGSIE